MHQKTGTLCPGVAVPFRNTTQVSMVAVRDAAALSSYDRSPAKIECIYSPGDHPHHGTHDHLQRRVA